MNGGLESRKMRDRSEVIVVGGSAAGLSTATHLANGGKAVRVLESRPDLDPVNRTLIVTDHSWAWRQTAADYASRPTAPEGEANSTPGAWWARMAR